MDLEENEGERGGRKGEKDSPTPLVDEFFFLASSCKKQKF
jgi:hypothetical protein